VAILQHVSIT